MYSRTTPRVTSNPLRDRIAALEKRTTPSPSSNSTSIPPTRLTSVRDKVARFDEIGGAPVPRGSFGLGAPPNATRVTKKSGELYGNRIPSVGGSRKADSSNPGMRPRDFSATPDSHSDSMEDESGARSAFASRSSSPGEYLDKSGDDPTVHGGPMTSAPLTPTGLSPTPSTVQLEVEANDSVPGMDTTDESIPSPEDVTVPSITPPALSLHSSPSQPQQAELSPITNIDQDNTKTELPESSPDTSLDPIPSGSPALSVPASSIVDAPATEEQTIIQEGILETPLVSVQSEQANLSDDNATPALEANPEPGPVCLTPNVDAHLIEPESPKSNEIQSNLTVDTDHVDSTSPVLTPNNHSPAIIEQRDLPDNPEMVTPHASDMANKQADLLSSAEIDSVVASSSHNDNSIKATPLRTSSLPPSEVEIIPDNSTVASSLSAHDTTASSHLDLATPTLHPTTLGPLTAVVEADEDKTPPFTPIPTRIEPSAEDTLSPEENVTVRFPLSATKLTRSSSLSYPVRTSPSLQLSSSPIPPDADALSPPGSSSPSANSPVVGIPRRSVESDQARIERRIAASTGGGFGLGRSQSWRPLPQTPTEPSPVLPPSPVRRRVDSQERSRPKSMAEIFKHGEWATIPDLTLEMPKSPLVPPTPPPKSPRYLPSGLYARLTPNSTPPSARTRPVSTATLASQLEFKPMSTIGSSFERDIFDAFPDVPSHIPPSQLFTEPVSTVPPQDSLVAVSTGHDGLLGPDEDKTSSASIGSKGRSTFKNLTKLVNSSFSELSHSFGGGVARSRSVSDRSKASDSTPASPTKSSRKTSDSPTELAWPDGEGHGKKRSWPSIRRKVQ